MLNPIVFGAVMQCAIEQEPRSRKSFGLHVLCHDQTCAPFVTWHFSGTPLKSSRRRSTGLRISAPGVHLIAGEPVGTRFTVKKLDALGMKYTNRTLSFFALLLATLAGAVQLSAQSPYPAGSPTL